MFKKRVLPVLLSLALTATAALPVVYAVESSGEAEAEPAVYEPTFADGVELNKTAVPNDKGGYTITMEAYTTGVVETMEKTVPTDIVLVLDQSTSMAEEIDIGNKTYYNELWSYTNFVTSVFYSDNLYCLDSGQYCKVSIAFDGVLGFGTYTYSFVDSSGQSHSYTSDNFWGRPPAQLGDLYIQRVANSRISKTDALKDAVGNFYNQVQASASGEDGLFGTDDDIHHRIAIVGFASKTESSWTGSSAKNTEVFIGDTAYNYASNNKHYNEALQDVATTTGQENIPKSINELDADGDTYSEYGLEMANEILKYSDPDRQKVVIMFTDGYTAPAGTDDINYGMSDRAIGQAANIKARGASVYTVGIFDGANPEADIESGFNYGSDRSDAQLVAANRYMNYTSSNFPNAKDLKNGGTRSSNEYYFSANDAGRLNEIFEQISESISKPTISLGENTVIKDSITPYFTVPDKTDVHCWTQDATGTKTGDVFDFSEEHGDAPNVNVSVEDRVVNITGFNFDENFVTTDDKDDSEQGVDHGRKLVIQFDVQPVEGFLGGNGVPTNGDESGIYAGDGKLVENFVNPRVDVPIQYDFGTQDDTIWLGEKADLASLLLPEKEGYNIDGSSNAFVHLTFKMFDPEGNLVGTRTIRAGDPLDNMLNDWVWEENANDGHPVLDERTEYKITCDVTPINKGSQTFEPITHPATVIVLGGTLTIHKTGGADGERYVFNIYKENTAGAPYMTVAVLNDGTTKITGLTAGQYIVVEDTTWSWRYKGTREEVTISAENHDAKVSFENQQDNHNWLNKYDWAVNHQKGGGSVESTGGSEA